MSKDNRKITALSLAKAASTMNQTVQNFAADLFGSKRPTFTGLNPLGGGGAGTATTGKGTTVPAYRPPAAPKATIPAVAKTPVTPGVQNLPAATAPTNPVSTAPAFDYDAAEKKYKGEFGLTGTDLQGAMQDAHTKWQAGQSKAGSVLAGIVERQEADRLKLANSSEVQKVLHGITERQATDKKKGKKKKKKSYEKSYNKTYNY